MGPPFLLRTNKEACKITKVPLLSVCKTKKAILPFNHRHKMHVLHPKQSELAMGYKIILWMQLQKYFDPNVLCGATLSFFNPLRKCHLTKIKTEISAFGDINSATLFLRLFLLFFFISVACKAKICTVKRPQNLKAISHLF